MKNRTFEVSLEVRLHVTVLDSLDPEQDQATAYLFAEDFARQVQECGNKRRNPHDPVNVNRVRTYGPPEELT